MDRLIRRLFASDEHRFPFLDEGLNSYAEHSSLAARYGSGSAFTGFGLDVANEAVSRAIAAARGADEAIAQGAGDFFSFRSLGAIVYSRTASLFSTIPSAVITSVSSRALTSFV